MSKSKLVNIYKNRLEELIMEDNLLESICWYQKFPNYISVLHKDDFDNWNLNFWLSIKFDNNIYIKKYTNIKKNEFVILISDNDNNIINKIKYLLKDKKYNFYKPIIKEENKELYNILSYVFLNIENIFNNRNKWINSNDLYKMFDHLDKKRTYQIQLNKTGFNFTYLSNE